MNIKNINYNTKKRINKHSKTGILQTNKKQNRRLFQNT